MLSSCSNTAYPSTISTTAFSLEGQHEDAPFFKTDMSNTSLTELLHPIRRQSSTDGQLDGNRSATTPLERVNAIVSIALELLEDTDEDDF